MNKTANFQLTQWEKTDRIMMEDFNRDNAAIDAALKSNADAMAAETAAREAADTALGKKAGLQLIETAVFSGKGKSSVAQLSINWQDWAIVLLQYKRPTNTGKFSLSFTEPNTTLYYGYEDQISVIFYPLYNECQVVKGHLYTGEALSFGGTPLFQNLTAMSLYADTDGTNIEGGSVTFYGIR